MTDKPRLILRGKSVGPGQAESRVRIVSDQADIEAFQPGGIFVSFTASPEAVAVMRVAAAIVTDVGGTKTSTVHPTIVARELGIPYIVRTRLATKKLRTGDRIFVDAAKGNIYLL